MPPYIQKRPRSRMRLPQLAKFHRRNRRPSEFVLMCENIAFQAQVRREAYERTMDAAA